MPRLARTVFAKVPHHLTQRGNRREDIFLTDEESGTLPAWLERYCQQHTVDILAYCLMTNHIHLVAVPATGGDLQRVLKPLHMRYAQRFNRQRGLKGHVWQGRYCPAALDDTYLWATLRYVERNPVRASLVRKAERSRWSSAAAHGHVREDPVLTSKEGWWAQCNAIDEWSSW